MIQAASPLSVTTINNNIFTHCEILTTSESSPHSLTRAVYQKSIKRFILVKREQIDMGGSALPLHLSVCAYQPLEKSLIRTGPLLICPADAAATAKTSVPVWQHDHSCFHQEWIGTLLLSTLQNKIKRNMMTSQVGVFPDREYTAPFTPWGYTNFL